jgi:signal transduction histidine kinase
MGAAAESAVMLDAPLTATAGPRPPERHPHAARPLWRALLALCCGLLGLLPAPVAAQVLNFDRALSAVGAGPGFPTNAPSREVALPDDWTRSHPGQRGPVWYRVHFQPSAAAHPGGLLALYVPQACTNLEVYLNGQLVHSGGAMTEPLTNHCQHPQLVALPTALIATGANTLDLRVAGHALAETGSRLRSGGLSAFSVGPQALLAPRHAWRTILNVTLPQALGATLLLTGGFMFVLGFINRRESHLAYFGALSVGWAVVDARLWLRSMPLDHAGTEFLLVSLMAFITLAGVQFLLRYAGVRQRLVDRLLPLQCALMPLSLVLAGTQRLYTLASLWTLLLALQALAAAAFYLKRQWAQRGPGYWLMASTLAVLALAALVEFSAQQTGARPLAVQLAQLAPPLMFVLVGLRLVQQHGRALQEAELGRAQLEQRFREATAEIERNFQALSELRVEQITERERKRIAADLHDDLGAKLLTIVHTSDDSRISSLAREALEEMRLSVRGLTGRPVRLADALGDWRAEVVNRLAQAGIEGEWSAPEDLPQTLSARAYVQTTRILREATSNIIKHSGASHCAVSCRVADGDFQLVVQDNGNGIATEVEARLDRGHGLASMKHRAKQLQGQCLVESGPGYGTVIRLTLPLDRALEAPPR